jgi:hypothetical protein
MSVSILHRMCLAESGPRSDVPETFCFRLSRVAVFTAISDEMGCEFFLKPYMGEMRLIP